MERAGRVEDLLARAPELEPALRELDLERSAELLADAAEAAARGPACERLTLHQQDVTGALFGQVISEGAADDAATDDERLDPLHERHCRGGPWPALKERRWWRRFRATEPERQLAGYWGGLYDTDSTGTPRQASPGPDPVTEKAGSEGKGEAMGSFIQLTINGLTVGSFYALVALGYTIVYGIIRLINFAQGDLSVVGAFLGWTLLVSFGFEHLPIYLALVIAFVVPMIGTAVVNLGILQFAYKPLLRRSLLAILITALGMSLLLQNAAELIWGAAIEAYPPNLLPLSGFFVGPVHVTYVQIALVTASLLLMGGLVAFVQGTTMGTAMRALAVDHDAARLMGIDVDAVIRIAFVLGAMLAAASGVMLGIYYVQIHFTMGFL